jgi:4-amino-4-deoxy-L-arabinose transferase-like glycosyltransferase
MLYHWARAIKGRDYSLVGTTILASTTLFYLASATVMTDLVMAAGVFLSMAGFYSAITEQKYARLWGYLFFVGLGIGMLAKGPVAVVLAAIPIGLWVLLKNRWVDTWNRLPWVEGTLLTCCIFLPWYVAAEIKTPGFLQYFIVGEHFHRFLDSGWTGDLYGNGHAEARGTIWLFWFAAVLPWSFFFLAPFRWTKRLYRGVRSEQDGRSLYLLCWAVSPMVFFTMATNIIATYVITGLPAISFLVIDLWRYARSSDPLPSSGLIRFFVCTAGVAAVFFLGAYIVFLVKAPIGTKKSQIVLIEKVNEMKSPDSGGLYYWHKRYYSADFYSGGVAKTLESDQALDALLENQKRDFISVRDSRIDKMPPEFAGHFQFIGMFGRDALYYEMPQASEPTSLVAR